MPLPFARFSLSVCFASLLVSAGCGRVGFEELARHGSPRSSERQDTSAIDEGSGDGSDAGLPLEPDDIAGGDASTDADGGGQRPGTTGQSDAGPVSDASLPPVTSDCVAGTYTGTFSGTITVPSLIDTTVTGTISVTTTASANGDLVITSGSIAGADPNGNPVTASVTGTVSCSAKQLESGTLTNGVYTPADVGQSFAFTGTASATYYPGAVPRVEGTYQTNGGIGTGAGTFSASLTP